MYEGVKVKFLPVNELSVTGNGLSCRAKSQMKLLEESLKGWDSFDGTFTGAETVSLGR